MLLMLTTSAKTKTIPTTAICLNLVYKMVFATTHPRFV
jgi:hypothetical protein